MEEAMFVHVGETKDSLKHNALNLILGEWLRPALHKLVYILFHVFKYKVEVIVDSNDFLQFHDERVIQFTQRLDLSQGHALLPRVELLLHLFDRHFFLRLQVDGLDDRTVRTIAESFQNFVPFHFYS